MHCICCDKPLTDYEATLRDERTDVYLDMCKVCIKESGIDAMVPLGDRPDLDHEEEVDQEILELD